VTERRRVPAALWLICLALATSAVLYADHAKYGASILWQSHGVASGHAEWRVYQNRILGPFLIDASARLFHLDYGVAFSLFVLGTLVAANLIAYYGLAGGGRYRAEALRYCFLLNAAFLVLQVRPFLYEWDCVDLIVFHLLVLGAICGRSSRYFAGVFLLELLNREAAAFVGVYVAVDGLLAMRRSSVKGAAWRRVCLGVAMCLVSAAVAEGLRAHLFVGTARDALERTLVLGQHWQVPRNLHDLARPGLYKSYALPWLVVGYSAVVCKRFQAARRDGALPLGITYAALTVSLLLFTVLQETRVLIPYAPFVLLLRLKEDHVAFLRAARAD
jgi:hypothetical protein